VIVTIVAVDKLREPYVCAGCELYTQRLSRYYSMGIVEVRPARGTSAISEEGKAILDRVDRDAVLWALDRVGTSLSSTGLAAKLTKAERSGTGGLTLAIGGALGLHASVLRRAQFVWSLSDLTLLHEMARLVVLEQLYRAAKINHREPYHR